jgi:hypothetical protein
VEIDRTRPPFRDDPVIAVLTDDQVRALAAVLARFAAATAGRIAREQDERASADADPSEVA